VSTNCATIVLSVQLALSTGLHCGEYGGVFRFDACSNHQILKFSALELARDDSLGTPLLQDYMFLNGASDCGDGGLE